MTSPIAGRLAQLRELSVPDDRKTEGEHLHFYTTPFDDRFIFEFVERRATHCDDGISNASVRLAALAQWRVASGRTSAVHAATIGPGALG